MTKKQNVLAKLMFKVRAEDARSFNVTQLGDLSETRMTLGSTKGKLKRKDLKKEAPLVVEKGNVALQWADFGRVRTVDENRNKQSAPAAAGGVTMSWIIDGSYDKKKTSADVFCFQGFRVASDLAAGEPDAKQYFVGSVNVATGQYQEWFGAQAALTYDTDKGGYVLSIYG